jgi:phage FluMu protein Com
MKQKESDWYTIKVCTNCEKRLNRSQILYESGRCPKCKHESDKDVCETHIVVLKETKLSPWWKFWNKKYRYKAGDEYSNRWLEKYHKE